METWLFIFLYLAVQFAITIYLSRKIRSEGDFFLAGREVPTWALAFSIFATWFGAETCIGSSASVYRLGLSGSKAEPFGYTICLLLVAVIIAPKVWNKNYVTMGDFFREKIGPSTEKLAIWILLPSSLIWAAAQVRAFGQVLALTGDISVDMAVMVATAFVIGYTFVGGLLGDIVTDVIQGVILSVSLLTIFILLLGNFESITHAVNSIPAQRFSLIAGEQSILAKMDSWAIPIFGSLVTQELLARILAAKNKSTAVRSSYLGAGLYFIFGSIPVMIGLILWDVDFALVDHEQFLPTVAKQFLNPFLYMIFIGALISAILSTVDSILLALSALVSHNLIVPFFKIEAPRKKLLSARLVVVVMGLLSAIMALYAESVYNMVELASSFGTTGILVITLAGIYHKGVTAWQANLCLVFGLIFSILFELVYELEGAFIFNLIGVSSVYIAISAVRYVREKSVKETADLA